MCMLVINFTIAIRSLAMAVPRNRSLIVRGTAHTRIHRHNMNGTRYFNSNPSLGESVRLSGIVINTTKTVIGHVGIERVSSWSTIIVIVNVDIVAFWRLSFARIPAGNNTSNHDQITVMEKKTAINIVIILFRALSDRPTSAINWQTTRSDRTPSPVFVYNKHSTTVWRRRGVIRIYVFIRNTLWCFLKPFETIVIFNNLVCVNRPDEFRAPARVFVYCVPYLYTRQRQRAFRFINLKSLYF